MGGEEKRIGKDERLATQHIHHCSRQRENNDGKMLGLQCKLFFF